MSYTIAVYEGGLAYGGPEEGGWWFWSGELVPGTTRHADDEESAWSLASQMVKRYPAGGDRSSVRPLEDDFQIELFEGRYTAPQFIPLERPHYE